MPDQGDQPVDADGVRHVDQGSRGYQPDWDFLGQKVRSDPRGPDYGRPATNSSGRRQYTAGEQPLYKPRGTDSGSSSAGESMGGEGALASLVALVAIAAVVIALIIVIGAIVLAAAAVIWWGRGTFRSLRRDLASGDGLSGTTVLWAVGGPLVAGGLVFAVAQSGLLSPAPRPANTLGAAGPTPAGAPPVGVIWFGAWDWTNNTMATRYDSIAVGQTQTFVATLRSRPAQFRLSVRWDGHPSGSPSKQYVTINEIAATVIQVSIAGGNTSPGSFEITILDSGTQQALAVGTITVHR